MDNISDSNSFNHYVSGVLNANEFINISNVENSEFQISIDTTWKSRDVEALKFNSFEAFLDSQKAKFNGIPITPIIKEQLKHSYDNVELFKVHIGTKLKEYCGDLAVNIRRNMSPTDAYNLVMTKYFISKRGGIMDHFRSNKLKFQLIHSPSERCYVSAVTSTTIVHGATQAAHCSIIYRIASYVNKNRIFSKLTLPPNYFQYRVDVPDDVNRQLYEECRKFSNFQFNYVFADFSGLLYYMGMTLGAYFAGVEFDWNTYTRNKKPNILTLSTIQQPAAACPGSIFISKNACTTDYESTFSAILGATAALGGSVVTDFCLVDPNNNAILYNSFGGAALMRGIWRAVNLLLCNLHHFGNSLIGMFMFIKGLHRTVTVKAHSDEGGIIRDILRQGRIGPPIGPIMVVPNAVFPGFPTWDIHNRTDGMITMDSIALVSAACSALSDPCCPLNGKLFPTIISRPTQSIEQEIRTLDEYDQVARNINSSDYHFNFLRNIFPQWAKNFAEQIREKFNCIGETKMVETDLQFALADIKDNSNHLKQETISPYYWIEPTSLFKTQGNDTATMQGYGVLCGTSRSANILKWENINMVQDQSTVTHGLVKMTAARKSGFILHHSQSNQDGLKAAIIVQANEETFGMRGGSQAPMMDLMLNNAGLDKYLWKRGDCGLPHPAEFICADTDMMVKFNHYAFDDSGYFAPTPIGSSAEVQSSIELRASRPVLMQARAANRKSDANRKSTLGLSWIANSCIQQLGVRTGAVQQQVIIVGRRIRGAGCDLIARETEMPVSVQRTNILEQLTAENDTTEARNYTYADSALRARPSDRPNVSHSTGRSAPNERRASARLAALNAEPQAGNDIINNPNEPGEDNDGGGPPGR